MARNTSPPESTPMTAVDTSWLRMESSSNCMMIGVVLIFDQRLSLSAFRQLLQERFLRFRRFRQRAVRHGNRYYWEDDPEFDLANHLHSIALPGKAGKAELQTVFSELNSTHLPADRPLWQMHHVNRYGRGSALLIRIHHCIADGISLVRVLLSLTDDNAEGKVTDMRPSTPAPEKQAPGWQKQINGALQMVELARSEFSKAVGSVIQNPRSLIRLGEDAWRVGEECVSLALQPFDAPTHLKGKLCGQKQVAWAEPLDLAEVKAVAKALGGTVNDVLTTAAAGALRAFLEQTSSHIPGRGLHVAVPFNLRPPQQPVNVLGNQFGLVLVNLPVALNSPHDQFNKVHDTMNRLKRSYQAQVSYSLLNIFGRGPDVLERILLEILSKKASAVMTNVPGPRRPVYLCGVRLAQPMFWVPQTGDIGVGLSIFSYHDSVQFGLISDKQLIQDPEFVVREFVQAFEALKAIALEKNAAAIPFKKQSSARL